MRLHCKIYSLFIPLAFWWPVSAAQAQIISQSAKYQECTKKVTHNTKDALAYADDWILRNNLPSAQHCRSLALFALKRYREAAIELERLSERITKDNAILWVNIMRQASQAWQMSKQRHRAIAALTRAILAVSGRIEENTSLAILTTELLMERSALYIYDRKPLDAIQDLDNAVAVQPNNIKLRIARAKLFTAMKEFSLAKEDLSVVLATSPGHKEATKLLKQL